MRSSVVIRGVVADVTRKIERHAPTAAQRQGVLAAFTNSDIHVQETPPLLETACFVIDASTPSAAGAARANTVSLRLVGDWAKSTAFVAVGDSVEVAKFDVHTDGGGLVLTANDCTELTVIRHKRIAISAANVGHLEVLELTDREHRDAVHAFNNAPPHRFGSVNRFADVDRYYDVIRGQSADVVPCMTFLQSVLGYRTAVLDAGCGSGLHAFALRGYGIYPTCVDASHVMQRRIEEKNQFFEEAETSRAAPSVGGETSTLMGRRIQQSREQRGGSVTLPFFLADLTNFSLTQRDTEGNVRHLDFEGVLCLDVLALLPSADAVRQAIRNLALHTSLGGVCVVTVPNATVVLAKGSGMRTVELPMDRLRLSVGAVVGPAQGTLQLTETELIRQPTRGAPDPVATRHTTWRGTAFHPRAPTDEGKFVSFVESFTELLLPAGVLEEAFTDAGFRVKELHGSLRGEPFVEATSATRCYVLAKEE